MGVKLWRNLLFLIISVQITLVACHELEQKLAEINKNGFTESLLYEIVKMDKKSNDKDLIKQLESPKVQKLMISSALKYASSQANDVVSRSMIQRNSWSGYCSYGWVRWLSFMKCDSNPSSQELDREEHHNFQIIRDDGRCYQKPVLDDW